VGAALTGGNIGEGIWNGAKSGAFTGSVTGTIASVSTALIQGRNPLTGDFTKSKMSELQARTEKEKSYREPVALEEKLITLDSRSKDGGNPNQVHKRATEGKVSDISNDMKGGIKDKVFRPEQGWRKMQYTTKIDGIRITVHYWKNTHTGQTVGHKIVTTPLYKKFEFKNK
jgi:hypothetical protein